MGISNSTIVWTCKSVVSKMADEFSMSEMITANVMNKLNRVE